MVAVSVCTSRHMATYAFFDVAKVIATTIAIESTQKHTRWTPTPTVSKMYRKKFNR